MIIKNDLILFDSSFCFLFRFYKLYKNTIKQGTDA